MIIQTIKAILACGALFLVLDGLIDVIIGFYTSFKDEKKGDDITYKGSIKVIIGWVVFMIYLVLSAL